MVSTLTAPLDGQVTALVVLPNQQVEQGDPLLRIRSSESSRLMPDLPGTTGRRGRRPHGARRRGRPHSRTRRLRRPHGLPARLRPGPGGGAGPAPRLPALRRGLRPRRPRPARPRGRVPRPLRRHRCPLPAADRGRVPRRVRRRRPGEHPGVLHRVPPLARRGARRPAGSATGAGSSGRSPATASTAPGDVDLVQRATFWLFRSFSRVPELADLVTEILGRRLQHAADLLTGATGADRARLERLVRATQGRQPAVTDAARDVLYHWFDAPVLSRVVAETEAEMRSHLAELSADPTGPDRADRIGRLVWCPQPMRSLLLTAWLGAGTDADPVETAFRRAVLETYLRRFYRMRDLHGLDFDTRERARPQLRPVRARRPAGARRRRLPADGEPGDGVARHRPAPRPRTPGTARSSSTSCCGARAPAPRWRPPPRRPPRCSASATSAGRCTASTSPSPRSRVAGPSAAARST